MRKVGKVYSVSPRGWVYIAVTPQDRYFGHISEQKSDHMLVVGETVDFDVQPSRKPERPGQLPLAVDIHPVPRAEQVVAQVADALSKAKSNDDGGSR